MKKIPDKENINLKERLKQSFENIFVSAGNNFMKKVIKTLLGAIQKFHRDEALIHSTSIGYNLIVSFIPTLVVALLIGARFINIDEIFFIADEFILKNSIPLDIEPYKNVIRQLLKNAGAITGVGFLIMFFSATSVLRNLENALNKIWRVHKSRPFVQKISSFIMVLLFGPALFMIGISITQSVLDRFSPPDLRSIKIIDQRAIALGDEHTYIHKPENDKWQNVDIVDKIDFELQREPIIINSDKNTTLSEKQKENILFKLAKANEADVRASTFTDITKNNNTWWITTNQGNLIYSKNDGKDWYIQRFQRQSGPILYKLYFNRIKFFNRKNGIIIGNNGLILLTNDSGKTWRPNYLANLREDLFNIERLNKNSYLIVGSNFTALASDRLGKTWRPYNKLIKFKKEKKSIHLTNISAKGKIIWVIGNSGTILFTKDQGETWEQKDIGLKRYNFRDIYFIDKKQGVLISEEGKIRFTDDGGDSWKKAGSPTKGDLASLNYDPIGKKMYVVGNSYHILINQGDDLSQFQMVQKPEGWRVFVVLAGNILLPFIIIWIVFFLIYKIVPYTFVSARAASIGAATTSILWVIFLLLYKYYISSFAKGTFAIYGTLAAIPLTLLLVYISITIMLFGAEISFYVQFPKLLKLSKSKLQDEYEKRQIWYGFEVLYQLYHNFENKKGETPEKELQKICNNDDEEFTYIMKHFLKRGYVRYSEEDSVWLPAISSKQILLKDVITDLDPSDYSITNASRGNQFMKVVAKYFSKIEKSKDEIFDQITFADLLKNSL